RGQTITYYLTVRGQEDKPPVPYELTLADYEGYYFENTNEANPFRIRYRLLGNREIQIAEEGKRGSRTITNEYVFEREFTPAGLEFRVRGGINVFTVRATGNFPASTDPNISKNPVTTPKPGWELGTQFRFKGNGGFISLNVEAGLMGKFSHVESAFDVITDSLISYVRDVTYRQTWLTLAAVPEINLVREGRLTMLAGPYYSRLLFNKVSGTELPGGDNKLFDANNDFKKNDVGIIAGFQYRWNFGKKDLGGTLGLRANLGLADLDSLYNRECNDPAFCNGRISLQGISLYYSINLLNL
ncbi:MAG: PorT family protein, partial [Bacteroidetes bacterium]